MSDKRKEEVIRLLTNTIESEQSKLGGGKTDIIEKLTKKLNSILDGTHVSKYKKKK
mgnify:CR=1 FL=1